MIQLKNVKSSHFMSFSDSLKNSCEIMANLAETEQAIFSDFCSYTPIEIGVDEYQKNAGI